MGNKLFFEKHGFLLFPTILSIFIIGMLGLALSTIYGNMFSTLSAGKSASQSQQFAEIEAEYLKLQGYDEADNLVHTWKTMEDFVGDDDGKNWESRLENIRTVNTASGDKVKIFKISTRKFGDVTSRYSLEVPLSSQSGYVPVGSVITWPSSNLPEWMTHGDYLECNGQSFDTSKYPRLYKALGTNHVPNYQGLFLRGYGSQNFTQNNGAIFGYTTVTYASGNMNEIQGDAMRRIWGRTMGAVQFRPATSWNPDGFAYGAVWTNAPDLNLFGYNVPSYDPQYGGGETRIPASWFVPYYSGGYGGSFIFMDSERITPIANENRPINVAVRYFIKAK